ncbi:MAG: hypothetical protein NC181_00370 [Clostridium sp.]|nr:hypothetical protein [Clostridium sp.]MCM1443881.1 hypothetical protein [Candidatus Amulumruptor caecigallinarius]
MILRKPYAFFIKHFRFFHFIMFIFLGIITYRTNLVRMFFSEYLNQIAYVISLDEVSATFNIFTYIWIAIVIIFSIIVFVVMKKKDKPIAFYFINIFIMAVTMVFMFYSNTVMNRLTTSLEAVATLRAIRDLSNILFIIQIILLIMTFIRATGFDIKKFDFGKDIRELSITAEDSEEFEFQFNFDWNESKRRFKKRIRELRYFILEYKKMIIIFTIIGLTLIGLFVYFNFGKFSKKYNLNSQFTTDQLTMMVTDSFITQRDYKSNIIADKGLVIVRVKASGQGVINTSKALLQIGNEIYYPIDNIYNNQFIDLGQLYTNQKLTNELSEYILVYEVPRSFLQKNMSFKYFGNYEKTLFGEKFEEYTVNLNSINLDSNSIQENYNIGDLITIDNQSLSGKLIINNYVLNNSFSNTYKYCVTKDECYNLKQYLQPSFKGTEDKILIRLNGKIEYNDNSTVKDDLGKLIEKYGTFIYKIEDKTYKTQNIISTNFSTVKDEDNIYIEIPKNLEQASNIDLMIKIRNKEYIYKLK